MRDKRFTKRWRDLPDYTLEQILTTQASVEELEAEHMHGGSVPFGQHNGAWEAIKGQMHPGDQLWRFRNSDGYWQMGFGAAGVALVRDGVVVASLVTRSN